MPLLNADYFSRIVPLGGKLSMTKQLLIPSKDIL